MPGIKGVPRKTYTDKEKLEAIQTFILLGSHIETCRTLGIADVTLRGWRNTQWWKEREDELRSASKLQLSAKLTKTVEGALDQLNDRVANGDWVYNRGTQKFERKPISIDSAVKAVNTLAERARILEVDGTRRVADEQGIKSRLDAIRKELLSFVNKTPLAKRVVEKDVIDVFPSNSGEAASLGSISGAEGDQAFGSRDFGGEGEDRSTEEPDSDQVGNSGSSTRSPGGPAGSSFPTVSVYGATVNAQDETSES